MPRATRPPGRWGTRASAVLTAQLLAIHYDPDLGFTPCYWCGLRADTADHWPIGRDEGGPDTLDNLVPACRPCNSSRGARYGNAKRARPLPPSREW